MRQPPLPQRSIIRERRMDDSLKTEQESQRDERLPRHCALADSFRPGMLLSSGRRNGDRVNDLVLIRGGDAP